MTARDSSRARKALIRALLRSEDPRSARERVRATPEAADAGCIDALEQPFRAAYRSDPRRAAALAAGAMAVAEIVGTARTLGSALWMLAVSEHVQGRHRRARRTLERAVVRAREAGDPIAEGDLQRIMIDVCAAIGDDGGARQAARRAAAAYRRCGGADARRRGSLAMNLGNLHHRADRHREAMRAYEDARRLYRLCGERVRVAHADFNRANILASLDRTRRARRLLDDARATFVEAAQTLLAARADRALAEIDRLEGNLDAARVRLERSREERSRLGDRLGVAHTELESAEVLLRLNRLAEADRCASAALRAFRRAGRNDRVAACEDLLARLALMRGRVRTAARRFERARGLFEAERNRVAAASSAHGLARADRVLRRPERSLAAARRAARLFGRLGLGSRRARALATVSEAALDLGRLRTARDAAKQALRLARGLADGRGELGALMALARVERQAGRPAAEYRRLLSAERCVERMRTGITAEESRLTFALDKSDVYEALIRNRLDRGDEPSARQALVFAERGKSRALAEMLAAAAGPGSPARSGEARRLLERLREVERRLALAEARLEEGAATKGIRGRGAARIRSLVGDRTQILARLSRVSPATATLVGGRPPEPWSVVEALQPDEMILEYAASDGRLHLFAIERGRMRVFPDLIGVAEVAAVVNLLRFHLEKGTLGDEHTTRFRSFIDDSLRRLHEKLFDALLGPVADELENRRLRVVPHGPLHGVPFHALESGGRAVVDRAVVSYAPSLTVLGLLGRERPAAAATPLVLGVPDRAAPAIEAEVRTVRARLGTARVYRGAEATARTLRSAGRRAAVLHVACHGFYSGDGPLTGGLRLGDAWVTLPEVYALSGTADLVVLSGCETGRGTVYSGDEWVGLVRGFLKAGARAVVASLWEVHDASAVAFMDDFYQGLSGGVAVADALTAAQRRARRQDAHPLHWAPFVVVGDPSYRLPRRKAA